MPDKGNNLAVTIIISTLCGFVGGVIASFLMPLLMVGAVAGAAVAAEEAADATREPIKQTGGDIRMIATAVEAYAIDNGGYPEVDNLPSLSTRVEPIYIKSLPYDDAWGNRMKFRATKFDYRISSAGADGTHGTADDFVYENGKFIQYPR